MKVFASALAAVALMAATNVQSFQLSPITTTRATFALRMNAYDEQLKQYYGQSNGAAAPANGATQPPAPAPAAPEYELANANPFKQQAAPVAVATPPPPPAAPVAPVAPVTPPPQDNQVSSGGLNFGSVVFLGMPLWLLLSYQVFFGGAGLGVTQPTQPVAQMQQVQTSIPTTNGRDGVIVLSQPITKAEVRGLFDLWNDALQTGDPATVAKRYGKDGVLLPTLSDIPRNNFEGIKDYFVGFLKKHPTGKILEGDIFIGNNWAQDAGIYEFTFDDGSKVKARYSFVYAFEDGKWMISHHHSSLMPQEVVRPVKVTESEVRGFFDLWNNALASGDPQKVADRYSKDAVLLPTLSDSARYSNPRIADYFVGFLKKKPDGKILEGNIKIGPNWAQDAGIYEFTFEDGTKTRGRYSFVYTYENGEWKISNHHSSIMPEPAVAAVKKVPYLENKVADLESKVSVMEARERDYKAETQPITKEEVRSLFNLWNDALQTGDPAIVAKRYGRDGVLLPTLSDVPRNDFEGIKDYFVGFLKKQPTGKILEGDIYVGNNWAQDAGIYEFTFNDGSKVKARYSFVYALEDGKWMISHHHSSLMPQEVVRPVAVTETEVRGFFDLWNDALATGDPQKVADRYSKDAVLLPTLSDSARYTNDRIADYFVGFLKKKPRGEILEGNVKIGPNWAQDAGIYEFTFEDGSKTRGRYSYVYTYENGEWKISNHHSSIMPEPAVKAIKTVSAMQQALI